MQTNDVKTKRVHNLIIVDESGSMEVIRRNRQITLFKNYKRQNLDVLPFFL